MEISVLLGVAHPYHENSYAWVVDVYSDKKVAQDICDRLNEIDKENWNKWKESISDDIEFETVKPFAWYSEKVLQQMRDIVPNAIPIQPSDSDEDSFGYNNDYHIRYKVETKVVSI